MIGRAQVYILNSAIINKSKYPNCIKSDPSLAAKAIQDLLAVNKDIFAYTL
jgi:hypothetical protein